MGCFFIGYWPKCDLHQCRSKEINTNDKILQEKKALRYCRACFRAEMFIDEQTTFAKKRLININRADLLGFYTAYIPRIIDGLYIHPVNGLFYGSDYLDW
jgi:hypothetical protein